MWFADFYNYTGVFAFLSLFNFSLNCVLRSESDAKFTYASLLIVYF